MNRKNQQWRVDIGDWHWQRHTHAGFKEQGFQMLGRVSRSGQFGALARSADGSYVQINGDHVAPLNRSKMEHAMRLAQRRDRMVPNSSSRREPSVRPAVTVKRRRAITIST